MRRSAALRSSRPLVFAHRGGCAIGPDYEIPDAPTTASWMDVGAQDTIRADSASYAQWWHVFCDPVLDSLVETAYRQNPTLHSAGARQLRLRTRASAPSPQCALTPVRALPKFPPLRVSKLCPCPPTRGAGEGSENGMNRSGGWRNTASRP